jgi:hypothetical protein
VAAFLTAQDSLARLLLVLSLVLLLRLGCVVLLLYHADDPAWQLCVRCIEAPCTRLTSVRQRLSPPPRLNAPPGSGARMHRCRESARPPWRLGSAALRCHTPLGSAAPERRTAGR